MLIFCFVLEETFALNTILKILSMIFNIFPKFILKLAFIMQKWILYWSTVYFTYNNKFTVKVRNIKISQLFIISFFFRPQHLKINLQIKQFCTPFFPMSICSSEITWKLQLKTQNKKTIIISHNKLYIINKWINK